MTALNKRRSRLMFETCDVVREKGKYREVVIEAQPLTAIVRLKGLRTSYTIPWSAVWSIAVKAEAARIRAEKQAKRVR